MVATPATHNYVQGYVRKDGRYVKPHWNKKRGPAGHSSPIVSSTPLSKQLPVGMTPAVQTPPPARLGPI
ncbi:hypothetical protein, partial [Salmonella sp. SAL4448]|uniref:hypothetical protein n=1 Tax=Salmonella sp. SAL4448 TaxID=3159903 RepID=UPI0039781785